MRGQRSGRRPGRLPAAVALGLALLVAGPAAAQEDTSGGRASVKSPDGTIEVSVHADGPLTYSVTVDGRAVVRDSRLGLKFKDGVTLGARPRLAKVERDQADTTWENRLGKRRLVRDRHNEMRVLVEEPGAGDRRFAVVVRAFDDGVAFRYVLPPVQSAEAPDFVLEEEQTQFAFPENFPCYAGENENTGKPQNPVGYVGSQEMEFKPTHLGDLPTATVRGLPLLVRTPGAYVNLAEADLRDWAGMWLSRAGAAGEGVTLAARLAPRPDGNGQVKSSLPHKSPWRVLMIARKPGRLIESDLINNLASPCELADTSWIKPGMMAWDRWWSGMGRPDTETFRTFIQFAADMGWPYQLMDAGWSARGDVTRPGPNVDMPELLRFAREHNVRLWVWSHWTSLDRDDTYLRAFPIYEQWGLAGVKIDFMNRDDQDMVNWYEKVVKAAAEHHLLIDFHGAFKPTGMIRTFPNQITREGILGNEYNKWSARVTPEHKVTLPFTRLALGPGDFTPGGFLNRPPDRFTPQTGEGGGGRGAPARPTEVQGTRCAELALFVCYESPVCCVADHPRHIKDQPGADFLKVVPTVWDDTKVLDGEVGRHLVLVRKSGKDWFLGALTDRSRRDIPVKLDFLGPGKWTLRLWKDAADSDAYGEHLDTEERTVTAGDDLTLHLAPAGGAVARFEPIDGR